jgi:hypothetical protein
MLHESAKHLYKRQHMWFSIPVIILSTLAGTANVAIASYVPTEHISIAQLVIGGINLFCGVLSTLSNYFRAAEKCESHNNAAIGWGKLYRSIFVELSLAREKRKPVSDFMRLSKNEYDRLTDNSPSVRTSIYEGFSLKLGPKSTIILPEECGNLLHASSWEHVGDYRVHVMEARGSLVAAKPAEVIQEPPPSEISKTPMEELSPVQHMTPNPVFSMGPSISALSQASMQVPASMLASVPVPASVPMPVQVPSESLINPPNVAQVVTKNSIKETVTVHDFVAPILMETELMDTDLMATELINTDLMAINPEVPLLEVPSAGTGVSDSVLLISNINQNDIVE